jgi:hypothetical protein
LINELKTSAELAEDKLEIIEGKTESLGGSRNSIQGGHLLSFDLGGEGADRWLVETGGSRSASTQDKAGPEVWVVQACPNFNCPPPPIIKY